MTILIADDDPFYRRLLQSTLAEWGYDVVAVADGEEAWKILRATDAPKMAILDRVMPGVEGLELCRRVRELRRNDSTYLILLTVKGNKDDIVAGLDGGADDYMPKPFDREELRARLKVGQRIVNLQTSLAAQVRELEGALCDAQKMEAIGRLAGGVAHDFNNILTIIIGYCDALQATLPADDTRCRNYTKEIRKAGDRAAALTHQLLAFSRKSVVVPVVLSLNKVVMNFEGMLRRLIGENIRLTTHAAPDVGCVRADPSQLEQVMLNLAVNARDAMPDGGDLTIETSRLQVDAAAAAVRPPFKPGTFVVLTVNDTGHGMDERTKAHIFEPFFTTKVVGKGTGLGLATVHGIVTQSGGAIDVFSEPGRGTTFRVYLPQVEAPETAIAAAALPAGPGVSARETVLLVEDDEAVRSLAVLALKAEGYTILEAGNGAAALEVSQRHEGPIDILVTDVIMPGMNGRELADMLRKHRRLSKVLYVSGYADDVLSRSGVLGEGSSFLQKPFASLALTDAVRRSLDGQPRAKTTA